MINKCWVWAAILAGIVGADSARADDDNWTGFYRAIDAIDGSIDSLSIVANEDETYRILMSSTKLGACSAGTGAGTIEATGRVVDDQLVRQQVMYRCDGADEKMPLPDSTYVRDEDSGVLMLEGPMGRVNYYHPIR